MLRDVEKEAQNIKCCGNKAEGGNNIKISLCTLNGVGRGATTTINNPLSKNEHVGENLRNHGVGVMRGGVQQHVVVYLKSGSEGCNNARTKFPS